MSIAHLYKITHQPSGRYYYGKHNGTTQQSSGQKYWGSGKAIKALVDKLSTANSGENNPRYGAKLSDEHIALLASSRAKAPKYECIHCKQMFMKQYITRYHNGNCKMKENN